MSRGGQGTKIKWELHMEIAMMVEHAGGPLSL